jgi:hypothetical protein
MKIQKVTAQRIGALISVATMAAGVAFAGYQYKEEHLPAFEKLQATVEYQTCINRCKQTCQANNVPLDVCNCTHCNVHKVQ